MQKIEFSSLNLNAFINRELKPFIPSRINNAYISENGFACFVFEDRTLAVSLSIRYPFVFFTDMNFKKRKTGFSESLSKSVKGLTAVAAEQDGYDRMFRITLNNGVSLRFILIPGSFNILITDSGDRIINLYSYKKKRDGSLLYSISDIYRGKPDKISPESAVDTASKKLVDAGLISMEDLFTDRTDFLPFRSGAAFKIIPAERGRGSFFVSEAVRSCIMSGNKLESEKTEEKRVEALLKKINALRSKIEKLESDDSSLQKADVLKERAEMIKLLISSGKNLSPAEIPHGVKPSAYMESLFSEAKALIEENRTNKGLIEKYRIEIEALSAQTEEPPSASRKPPAGQKKEKRIGRKFSTPSGLTVLSGRNATENDLLLKSSKRGDIYFHANEAHGSAAILKTAGKQPQLSDIEFAASVAAYYSEGKHSSLVSVVYEDVKYVVKRKGDPKGMAHMLRSKSIMVKPAELH